jgi:glycosyltransferase involved in cell wall biosynthesis
MRIGIDGGCLANRRGFGRMAQQLLAALARDGGGHEYVVLLDRPSAAEVELPPGCEPRLVDVREAPSRAASAGGRRSVRDLLAMSRAAAAARLDLLYFPASYSYFPVWGVPRVVVTIYDTLPLDRPDLVFPAWPGRIAWRLKEAMAVRQADLVVTTSEASARSIGAWYGIDRARLAVVPAAPAAAFRPQPRGLDAFSVRARYCPGLAPFLLYVGGLSPHKNLPRLIEAFARAAVPGLRLLLVGSHNDVFHTHIGALREAIERWEVGDRVTLPGFVPDEDLAHLYTQATALVQPSLVEGFGLPPVEAMACGAPVLYSRAGSLPEVIGDAGLAFDPTDVGAMAAAIRQVAGSLALRTSLSGRSLARAARYDWATSARALRSCLEATADGARGRRAG